MIKLYFCRTEDIEETLKEALHPHICGNYAISCGVYGKPYIEGNPVFFSISHSGDEGVVLVSDKQCGVDLEVYKERKIDALYSRLTSREKVEIQEDYKLFLKNWVAKEAYIKYLGGTVAWIKRLEYAGGVLYFDGKKADCNISVDTYSDRAVYAVCTGDKK
ncbi:MAG: hypothetical protein K2O28_02585 [Clostridia bacterium]|nr:hypothetical protein [Clostridia bacterium]